MAAKAKTTKRAVVPKKKPAAAAKRVTRKTKTAPYKATAKKK